MRTLLVTLNIVVVLIISLAVGLLAADWPFWQRAWQWERHGWPERLPGATLPIAGAAAGSQAFFTAAAPASAAETQLLQGIRALPVSDALLVLVGERVLLERYRAGRDAAALMTSRELAGVLPAFLYGIALAEGRALGLDAALAQHIPEWRDDGRGMATPRQLLWNLSGLEAPVSVPWNPLHRQARLASGPDFTRAALSFRGTFPPGSHFQPSPANPQLLGLVLERATGTRVAPFLQARLWQPVGAGAALATADREAGRMALHCCFNAAPRDWLRLGALLANDGVLPARPGAAAVRVLPPGWVRQMATASPVHPGYGLGVAVDAELSGAMVLTLAGNGRRIWVLPRRHVVVLWFDDRSPAAGLDQALKDMLQAM